MICVKKLIEYVEVDDISDVTLVASNDRTLEAHKICVYNHILHMSTVYRTTNLKTYFEDT